MPRLNKLYDIRPTEWPMVETPSTTGDIVTAHIVDRQALSGGAWGKTTRHSVTRCGQVSTYWNTISLEELLEGRKGFLKSKPISLCKRCSGDLSDYLEVAEIHKANMKEREETRERYDRLVNAYEAKYRAEADKKRDIILNTIKKSTDLCIDGDLISLPGSEMVFTLSLKPSWKNGESLRERAIYWAGKIVNEGYNDENED